MILTIMVLGCLCVLFGIVGVATEGFSVIDAVLAVGGVVLIVAGAALA